MKTKPNYVRPTVENGVRHFWVSKAALIVSSFGPDLLKTPQNPEGLIFLSSCRPKKAGGQYHRVTLEVVRTVREAAALDRKFERARKRGMKRFKKLLAAKKS